MTLDITIPTDDWVGVSKSLAQLRARGDELEQFVLQQLDDLDGLRCGLADRGRRLDEQTQLVVQRGTDIDLRLSELETQQRETQARAAELRLEAERLAVAHGELDLARQELAQAQAGGVATIGDMDAVLRQRVEELERHCATLESNLGRNSNESEALAESTDRLSELEQELAAVRNELEKTRRELAEQREGLAATDEEALRSTREQLATVQLERAALSDELHAARSQAARMADVAMELADAREELADARAELAESRKQLLHDRETVSASAGYTTVANDESVQVLQQERAALEAELEVVRNRAAELAESAADEKRRGAEERAEWSGELKQLRRALEKQAQLLLRYQELASSSPAHTVDAPGQRAGGGASYAPFASDPVLDSVMAQFEMLQKDLVKRRGDHHKANRQDVA